MRQPKVIALAAAVAGALSAGSPAAAAEWPWCAELAGDNGGGGTNCGFASWEQCQATISGIGGWCYPNPNYREPAPRRRERRQR